MINNLGRSTLVGHSRLYLLFCWRGKTVAGCGRGPWAAAGVRSNGVAYTARGYRVGSTDESGRYKCKKGGKKENKNNHRSPLLTPPPPPFARPVISFVLWFPSGPQYTDRELRLIYFYMLPWETNQLIFVRRRFTFVLWTIKRPSRN